MWLLSKPSSLSLFVSADSSVSELYLKTIVGSYQCLYVTEYSVAGDSFIEWSIDKNGYKRIASGLITYTQTPSCGIDYDVKYHLAGCNVVKISSDNGLGAALTLKGDVYIWGRRMFTEGKGLYTKTIFETLLDEKYEDILVSKYLYAMKGDKVRRINYDSHFKK